MTARWIIEGFGLLVIELLSAPAAERDRTWCEIILCCIKLYLISLPTRVGAVEQDMSHVRFFPALRVV